MKKADLVKAVKETILEVTADAKLTNKDVEEVVNRLFNKFVEELKAGRDVTLPGIGKLVVVETQARKGRNPQTGEEIDIPAGKRVKFKPSKAIKEALNE